MLLCLLFAMAGAPAVAADKSGSYAIRGMGAKSCYSYRQAREQQADERYRDYLAGYLSAFNVLSEDTYSISGGLPTPEILLWLDDFCASQQMFSFEHALYAFVEAHQEKRMRSARPKQRGWGGGNAP